MRILVLSGTAALIGAILLTLAQSTPSRGPERAVLDRLKEIQSAAEALQPDTVFSFVMENNAGALAENGKLLLTRQEALNSTESGFRGIEKLDYRFDRQHVSLLSPKVALVVGDGSSSATLSDGRSINTRFAQSVVMILTNGDWQVFHAHRSFVAPR